MQILLRWLVSAAALLLTVKLGQMLQLSFFVAPGVKGALGLVLMVAVLGIVNAIIRPVLQFIALPLTCLTFGLTAFLINGLMFWLAGQVVPGFHVAGWVAPLFGSAVMGLISGALNLLVIPGRERD